MKLKKSHLNIKNNHLIYLSIGSNVDNKLDNINLSLKYLRLNGNINILKISSIYNTEPMYYKNQDSFLNLVVKLNTSYAIHELLKFCKSIEAKLGRIFTQKKNRPRPIDLDILTYDDIIYSDDTITLPHPGIEERNFVLVPFNEIASNHII